MVAVFELGRPTLLMDYLFWQRDNRQVAADWIRRNLPIGATIGFDRYNPPVTGELYGIEKISRMWGSTRPGSGLSITLRAVSVHALFVRSGTPSGVPVLPGP